MASRGVRSDVPRYVDVRLRIRPGHGDLYSVVAHSSVGGDGEEDVRLPVPPAGADEQEAVRAFGQALFESVFVGSVRSVYDRTRAKQEPDQELRLVLDATPPREVSPTLLSLP